MNPFKKLAGETAIYGLSTIIGKTLNFLLLPLYTSLFPPDEYAIITNLYAHVAFLLIFLTFGMETAFFRYSKIYDNDKRVYNTTTTSILLVCSLFLLLLFLFLKPLSAAIGYAGYERFIVWLGIIVAIDCINATPFTYLRRENKPIRFATLKLINIGINIGLNLIFFLVLKPIHETNPSSFLGSIYNPRIGVGYVFISNLVANVVGLLLMYPEYKILNLKIDKPIFKRMFKYAFPILIVGIAGQINQNIDKILLKYLIPSENDAMHQLGVYGANYKLAVLMTMFVQAFNYAFEPFFFGNDDSKENRKDYASIMKYFIILGWLIFLGITLYIDIFKHLESSAYHEGLKVVPWILFANLLLGIYYNQSIWYKVTNLTKYGAYQSLIGALITLVINIVLIPYIGYMACAIACVSCYLVMVLLSYKFSLKYYKIDYDLKSIGKYSLLALLIYAISIFLPKIITYKNVYIKLIINTILILIYLLIIFKKEIQPLLKQRKAKG